MPTPAHERLMTLAIDLSSAGHDDLAMRASELSNEIADTYVLANAEGDFPTNAQGVALARMMRTVMRDDRYEADPSRASARVHRGGFGCGPDYLTWQLGDDYCGGIDREGRVST